MEGNQCDTVINCKDDSLIRNIETVTIFPRGRVQTVKSILTVALYLQECVIPDTGYIKKTLILKFRRFMMSECTPQIRGVLDFF